MGKLNDEKKQIRQNDILNFILNYPGEYSIDEIAKIFEVSSRTIRTNYGKLFESQGVVGKTRKKKYGVKKVDRQIETIKQISCGKEDAKKCYILFLIMYVYKEKVLYNELVRGLLNNYLYDEHESFEEVEDIKEDKVKHRQLYLKKLISELKQASLIRIDKDYVKVVSENKLSEIDEYKLQEFLIYLNVLKEIHPKVSVYKRIFNKLSVMCKNFKENIITVDKLNGLSIFDELKVETIREAIYKNKCISFYYKKSNSDSFNLEEVIIPLGIIYNHYKDQWYLSAYSGRGKRQEEKLYRLDKIINIVALEEEGTGYFKKEMFEDAIGINLGPSQEVEVHFDNEEFIKRKLEIYCRERKKAKLYEEDSKLILIDEVSGITEFESWIRGFGKSAKCIKCQALIKRINKNLNKLKERYESYE